MLKRKPYSGTRSKLVLAFDIGTTFSGISYCILDPGEIPVVRGVTRYPAQECVGGDSKIPSVIYYNQSGQVRAVGAEAVGERVKEEAEENDWIKAEWFKLHLRPNLPSTEYISQKIPALPSGQSILQVFADFLQYLHECTREFIEETHANGVKLWSDLQAHTEVVLSHPNGWEGGQQAAMRAAAIMAGLIPDTREGRSRLSFVTEGEASLNYCIQSGLITKAIQDNNGVLIVDAGGGTVDISAYKQTSLDPCIIEEIAPAQCAFTGSVFVTRHAREFLEGLLADSKFVDDIPYITEVFDKVTKLRFVNEDEAQFIKFGGLRDKSPELNIRSGQLKLLGSDVAKFFEPSVTSIIEMIEDQCKAAKTKISSIFLVGGFAASNWLFKRLQATFTPRGLDVSRPDTHTNKAVADGAVIHYIDHFVQARMAKYSYGVEAAISYNPNDQEHILRRHWIYTDLLGHKRIGNHFTVILKKNTAVAETQEFRRRFSRIRRHPGELNEISEAIMCFRGWRDDPKWLDEQSKLYSTLCWVEADTSDVPKPGIYSHYIHDLYYKIEFDIVLLFGLTELKAFIAWKEDGVEKRSPAQLVYDPDRINDIVDGADR